MTLVYVAVGEHSQFEDVFKVNPNGFRTPLRVVLGQMMKFHAVNPNTFEGPFEMTEKEINKKYGPIRQND